MAAFGTLSPGEDFLGTADQQAMSPETYQSPLGKFAVNALLGMLALPKKAITAAATPAGLRREDFTDIPANTTPDPNSPLGGVGVSTFGRIGWQPGDELIGHSLEGAMNVMGGTSLSAPAAGAGQSLGAGIIRRDPALWHGISKVKLPKPISEMSAVHVPTVAAPERVISPASLQGGNLLPLQGDRTVAGSQLAQVNGFKFENPVDMQGGHGFMAANADRDAAWASGQSVANGIGAKVRREAGDAPTYGVYTAMGERSADFSHHVSDTLAEMLKHTSPPKGAAQLFDAEMRKISTDWPGVRSEGLGEYLAASPGALRNHFAKTMDTATFQKNGFPSVAEARFAVTDPRLLNEPTGAAGLSIARLDPEGRTFKAPDQHRSYDTNLAGTYEGGLPASIPKEVMFPDIVKSLDDYAAALPGYKPTTDYLMARTPKGLPVVQKADQQWVDGVSKHLEDRGFTLGAGAADKRAAAVTAVPALEREAAAIAPTNPDWYAAARGVFDEPPAGYAPAVARAVRILKKYGLLGVPAAGAAFGSLAPGREEM